MSEFTLPKLEDAVRRINETFLAAAFEPLIRDWVAVQFALKEAALLKADNIGQKITTTNSAMDAIALLKEFKSCYESTGIGLELSHFADKVDSFLDMQQHQ